MTSPDAAQAALERSAAIAQVRRSLSQPPNFTVYGVSNPALTPSRLIDVTLTDGTVVQLSLGFGESGGSAGRFIRVYSSEQDHQQPELAELLDAEARRVGKEITQSPPTAPELTPAGGMNLGIPMEVDGMIVVAGLPVPAHLRRQGRVWAAHITVSPKRTVTVVARGVDPGTMELSEVGELRPYVAAWEEFELKALAAQAFMSQQEAPPMTPSRGLNAHVSLMQSWLDSPPSEDNTVIGKDSGTDEQAELWAAAVTLQSHYTKSGYDDAVGAIAEMVNQAVQLQAQRQWREGERSIGSALEEMARYTIFDSDVASRRAQEWWNRVWTLMTSAPSEDDQEAKEQARERTATQAIWLTAWNRWAQGDDGHGRNIRS